MNRDQNNLHENNINFENNFYLLENLNQVVQNIEKSVSIIVVEQIYIFEDLN